MKRHDLLCGAAFVAASLCMGGTAFAQAAGEAAAPPAASAADAPPNADGEIIVTGTRRATTVQNTGAVISVLTAESLDKSGAQGSMALQFQTPGVLISQDLSLQTQVYIRGIGSNLQGIAVSNSVATYVDGIYISNTIQSAQSFNDVERIEVLKGPQATLYGRNATGGAINVVSAKPSMTTGGKFDASYGNYDAVQIRGSLTGALTPDVLAARLSVQYSKHGGYAKNLFNGKDILQEEIFGLRGSLLWTPTNDLEVILRGDYSHTDANDFLKLLPSTSVYYIGNQQYFTPRRRAAYYDIQPEQPMHDFGGSATILWDTGLGKITSITGARQFKAGPIFGDSDQVPVPGPFFPAGIGFIGSTFGSKTLYHETYLATDAAKPLSAIIGGTYFRERATEFKRILGPTLAVPNTFTDRFARTDAYSFYIDGTYRLTEQLNVVGGVRYSHETKDYDFYRRVPALAPTFSSDSYKNWSPRIGIEYRPQPGLLLYATATSGFKSGGFNTDTPSNGFGPEKIWSYEGGIKSTLFDRLRLNASGFYYDYKNIQVLQYLTINSLITPIITNAGSAKLYGLDATADFKANSALTVGGGLSYLHTAFGSATFCDPLFGSCTASDPANRPFFNVKGNRLPRAPQLSATAYFDYKLLVGDGDITFHGDTSYRSKTYYTVFQNDLYAAPGFWLFGANVRYTLSSGWYFEGYGQNLANKLAITQIINSSPLRNPSTGVIIAGTPSRFERYSPPRTYGVRVGVKF